MRERFVCVRITKMNHLDISRFEFDFDTTWAGFFLDEKLNVYSRYGGRDEGEPDERISKSSLLTTMREVLDAHSRAQTEEQNSRIALYQTQTKKPTTPEDIPLLKKNHHGCVHCHQIREYRLLQWTHDGIFDRKKLFRWPLPENVGLKFDREHGHRVERVLQNSAAEKAGLRVGDIITQVNDIPIRSEFDFRWSLNHAANDKPMSVIARRNSDRDVTQRITTILQPDKGFRMTDVSWHVSMRSMPLEFGFRGYALTRSQLKKEGYPLDRMAIRIISVRDRGLSSAIGLAKRDVVVALEKQTNPRTLDQLKSDLLRRYQPGDKVRITVRRARKTIELTGPFPPWHTNETAVP